MLKESAIVTDRDSHGVWVEARKQSTCDSCMAKKSCGHRLLDSLHSKRSNGLYVKAGSTHELQRMTVGSCVTISIEENQVLTISALFYLLPLLTLVSFSMIAELFDLGEFLIIVAALLGLGIGLLIVRHLVQAYLPYASVGVQAEVENHVNPSKGIQAGAAQ